MNGVKILRAQGPPLNHLGGLLMTTATAKDRLRLSRDPTGEMPRPGAPAPGGPAPRAAALTQTHTRIQQVRIRESWSTQAGVRSLPEEPAVQTLPRETRAGFYEHPDGRDLPEFTALSESLWRAQVPIDTRVQTVLLKPGTDWINHSLFFRGNCKELFLDQACFALCSIINYRAEQ